LFRWRLKFQTFQWNRSHQTYPMIHWLPWLPWHRSFRWHLKFQTFQWNHSHQTHPMIRSIRSSLTLLKTRCFRLHRKFRWIHCFRCFR